MTIHSPAPPATTVVRGHSEASAASHSPLQDLQHQLRVRTIALQSLQHDQDAVLRRLERAQTKSAAFEKKFEASDTELATLKDEQERLQTQVTELEAQVTELQRSKETMRNQSTSNGGQYMKILEMASRLQAQAALDKKAWAAEKDGLEKRLEVLQARVASNVHCERDPAGDAIGVIPPDLHVDLQDTSNCIQLNVPSLGETDSAEQEVTRLRYRLRQLELVLASVKADSLLIAQACTLVKERGVQLQASLQAVDDRTCLG